MRSNSDNNTKIWAQVPIADSCPHCNSTNFIRNGISTGVQRYKCKSCHKTFKDSTGTPLHWLHKKEKIDKYLTTLRKGLSVRKAAKYTGVSKNTAFAWRHKLLSSLAMRPTAKEDVAIAGMAIIRTPYSAKGRQKEPEKHTYQSKSMLIITDRSLSITKVQHFKSTKDASRVINNFINKGYSATLPDKLLTKAIKQQDKISKIKVLSKRNRYKHKATSIICELEEWMEKFRGVASKYLQHYWSWYTSINTTKTLKDETRSFNFWAISSRSLNIYRKTAVQ